MVYVKSAAPAPGTKVADLIRYYDEELQKLVVESIRTDTVLEAVTINGVQADWFWDDSAGSGEPLPGEMRGNSNIMNTITLISVNFIDAEGRSIIEALRTSTIEPGDLLSLLNLGGLGAGNYNVSAPVNFFPNHIEIPVDTFQGTSGNPMDRDVMELRWEFNTAPPQRVLP